MKREYSGILGNFTYDDKIWEIKTNNECEEYLHYCGPNIVDNLPDGYIGDMSHMFINDCCLKRKIDIRNIDLNKYINHKISKICDGKIELIVTKEQESILKEYINCDETLNKLFFKLEDMDIDNNLKEFNKLYNEKINPLLDDIKFNEQIREIIRINECDEEAKISFNNSDLIVDCGRYGGDYGTSNKWISYKKYNFNPLEINIVLYRDYFFNMPKTIEDKINIVFEGWKTKNETITLQDDINYLRENGISKNVLDEIEYILNRKEQWINEIEQVIIKYKENELNFTCDYDEEGNIDI